MPRTFAKDMLMRPAIAATASTPPLGFFVDMWLPRDRCLHSRSLHVPPRRRVKPPPREAVGTRGKACSAVGFNVLLDGYATKRLKTNTCTRTCLPSSSREVMLNSHSPCTPE